MRGLAKEEIVLQYSLVAGLRVSCIAIEKEGWLGKGSVSRYKFCIVTEAAELGWENVSQYKNCIATKRQGSWARWGARQALERTGQALGAGRAGAGRALGAARHGRASGRRGGRARQARELTRGREAGRGARGRQARGR